MKWQHVRQEPAIWSYLEFTRNLVWMGGGARTRIRVNCFMVKQITSQFKLKKI
jgi:hypothetical protein